jgi:hypothetical protein
MPFLGSVTVEDRLFGAAMNGIYDISASVTAPAAEILFPVADATSGHGQWTNLTTIATGKFLLYTDETNGYYTYTESTGNWLKVTAGGGANQISGVDPALFVSCMIFKSRVWFVEKNTASAWYLPVDALYGVAVEFNFGNKFRHGGNLANLYNWTVDGGEGIDDYLVAVSTSGDVVVYKGSDPATATDFEQHGMWFIGPPPVGRRLAGTFGGELYLLSSYGLLPISKLISGVLVQQGDAYLTKRITPLINSAMAFTREEYGWEVRLIPTENLVLISSPKRTGFPYIQFVYSLNTPGWALYRDVPYLTGETWHGNFYFADEDDRVLVHTGDLDDVDLTDTTSEQIEWSLLMCFLGYGADGNYKRAQFIRPIFIAEQAPGYSVEARYDYNLSEVFNAASAVVATGSVWDVGLWDFAIWGGEFVTVDVVQGGSGLGRVMSIGLNGRSGARTILVKFDLLFDMGGML